MPVPSCRSIVQSTSRFPKLCSSQHKCLAPGMTAEPGQKTRDLRKCKINPKPALHSVGRNQFRNNMGNFCPDPTNLLVLLSLTGEWLDSPHSLYTMPRLFHRVEMCLCVLFKPFYSPEATKAFLCLFSILQHYHMPL